MVLVRQDIREPVLAGLVLEAMPMSHWNIKISGWKGRKGQVDFTYGSNQVQIYRTEVHHIGHGIQSKQGTYKPAGHVVPQQGTANSKDGQLVHDGGNVSFLPMSNPLSSFDLEKIDNADQTLGENFLMEWEWMAKLLWTMMRSHTERIDPVLPHSPCKSKNKCLEDAKGIHETLDIHQGGGTKESKYYNASVLYLSLHNISP